MASHAALGAKALEKGAFDEAISHYTAALRESPTSPDYYIKRGMAYQRAVKYEEALNDSSIAVVAAVKRAKRELILQAQLRRGIALFSLERYGDAKFVFDIVHQMDPKEKLLGLWQGKVSSKLAGLGQHDEKAKVTAEKIPDIEIPLPESETKPAGSTSSRAVSSETKKPVTVERTPPSNIKHDWYQTNSTVYISLLAKGVPKDKAVVEIQERSIQISFPTGFDTTYDFSLDPLFDSIDVSKSTYRITPAKIEIALEKTSTKKWPTLETADQSKIVPASSSETPIDSAIKKVILDEEEPLASQKAPSYPTSSKNGPKNWDKVALDLEVDKEGDDVNNFFQTLYAGASEDTKRAMMKSYQESNGTVLSTNWDEVGKAKVETSPPDGMVAKKWGEE